jgi:hypothetical protein
MSYTAEQLSEREFALREAEANDAEERYFEARPVDDGAMHRRSFRAGFERAWDAKERELTEARAECERLRADAERYRWLRQYPIDLRMWAWTAKLLEKLDAAIDAERKP